MRNISAEWCIRATLAQCVIPGKKEPAGGFRDAFNCNILLLLQGLCGEAMQLLCALADHSPGALTGLEGHNLELGHQACHEGSPWESVLVSRCSIVCAAVHNGLSSQDAPCLALQN